MLVFNKSLSNLTILLILRHSFQSVPNLSMSKVEKKNSEKVYYYKLTSERSTELKL